MISQLGVAWVTVRLQRDTVSRLKISREGTDKCLDDVVRRIVGLERHRNMRRGPGTATGRRPNAEKGNKSERYLVNILGRNVVANTLAEVFAEAVDIVHSVSPEAIEQLAQRYIRTRRHVARNKDCVHSGRPDLAVLRSRSLWWVSANVSEQQTIEHLKALCRAAGLTFGKDIRFPA